MKQFKSRAAVPATLLVVGGVLASCWSSNDARSTRSGMRHSTIGLSRCTGFGAPPPQTTAPDANWQTGTVISASTETAIPQPATSPAPATPTAVAHADRHALRNVHRIGAKMISGSGPEGDPAFDELKAMGVKTIISVDGSTPEVRRAEVRGMRYVHIPVTYATVTRDQQLEIARAVRDLPGPIYIHCHHGKHRGPSAAAAALITLGEITPEQGTEFQKQTGTAPAYRGLYECVATATVASRALLDAAPATFPSVRKPDGLTGAMVEVDQAFENLGFIQKAEWGVPKDHPDLVPAAEAGRLADHMRHGGEDPRSKALGAEFLRKLSEAHARATGLEELIVAKAPKDQIEATWTLVAASCTDCHTTYRDVKR